ncbi:MAG: F0F1 ATP synthase subunit epsilon [Dehalococcoidales bacterium]|nr:MAG: F0F1 ATP synthase subunit epsilon [Dehalococcoidales bacterium]
MMTIRLDIVTAEQLVFSDDVDIVVAPGIDGELAVLPRHAPLMTMLQPGELRLRKGGEETLMAITGGFLEVRPDRVTVLADAAERAEDIDAARAEEAKRRAEERLSGKVSEADAARAEAALRRSLLRLRVAEKRRRRRSEL